jgi:hypothetical protein
MNRLTLILICFSAVAVVTAVRIEVLNAQAGGILPREVVEEGNPKWRVVASPESFLIKRYEIDYRFTNNFSPDAVIPEEVSRAIAIRVAAEAPRYHAEAKLRGVVDTWGLLQYPLCLILGFAGVISAVNARDWKQRYGLFVLGIVGFSCFGLAFFQVLGRKTFNVVCPYSNLAQAEKHSSRVATLRLVAVEFIPRTCHPEMYLRRVATRERGGASIVIFNQVGILHHSGFMRHYVTRDIWGT